MLPKNIYNKVIQSLRSYQQHWEEDRREHPNAMPYDVTHQVKGVIEHCMQEGGMRCHKDVKIALIDEMFDYLIERGILIKDQYGGYNYVLK